MTNVERVVRKHQSWICRFVVVPSKTAGGMYWVVPEEWMSDVRYCIGVNLSFDDATEACKHLNFHNELFGDVGKVIADG